MPAAISKLWTLSLALSLDLIVNVILILADFSANLGQSPKIE